MLENGYIRLSRSMLKWEWYTDPNTMRVFIHLLLTVNYEDRKFCGIIIQRGQRKTSYPELAQELRLSEQNIRTAVKHLILTGELTVNQQMGSGLFSVYNYDKYQQLTGELTDDQQVPNRQLTDDQQVPNSNGIKLNKANKANKAKKEIESAPVQNIFGEFGKVRLSDDEYGKLVQRLGKDSTADYIARLDGWLAEGHSKKNHYATVLNWWRKDGGGKSQGNEGKGTNASFSIAEIEDVMKTNAFNQTGISTERGS